MNKQELFEKALNQFDEWPFTKELMLFDVGSTLFVGRDIMLSEPTWLYFVCTREEFEAAKAERDGFKSGQEIFIAQINTLAGVEGQRYFIKEYWCNSGHQRQYVELGIVFDNKKDAENKCKELLGIPIDTRTDKEKAVDDLLKGVGAVNNSRFIAELAYDKWIGDKQ